MQRRRWKVRDVVELALILGGLILIGSPFFLLGGHFATRPPPQPVSYTHLTLPTKA